MGLIYMSIYIYLLIDGYYWQPQVLGVSNVLIHLLLSVDVYHQLPGNGPIISQ